MRDRIEAALERWGRFVYRRAGWVIALVVLATAAFGTQLQHFYLDATTEGFFHPDDPIRIQYNRFREQYGRETLILVALEPKAGIFDPAFLEELRTLHEEIENEVPLLAQVDSLINARETLGHAEGLNVGELMEDWPETAEAWADVERRALANPLYRNNLISADGKLTAIAIETQAFRVEEDMESLSGFDDEFGDAADSGAGLAAEDPPYLDGSDDREINDALFEVLERHRSDDLTIYAAGSPVFTTSLTASMQADMSLFSGLSILAVAILLAFLFRTVGGVVLPLVTVVASVVVTLSLMGATGTPMMPPTQIVPSFLLAVGIGGAVHLLAIFYQARRRGDDEQSAVAYALAHSGLAIIMTSLTTAGGLLSFMPAALLPISQFGWIMPFGVMVALVFILTLLPALMAVFPMRVPEARADNTPSQRVLVRVGSFSTARPGLVIGIWALVLLVSGVGAARLVVGHHMLEWFPDDDPVAISTKLINDRLGGSVSYQLLFTTGTENGFHDPAFLRSVDEVQRLVDEFEESGVFSGKSISLVDVIKETHKALNENRPDFYAVPDDRMLVSQELLLFENAGSDDVEDFVDPQFNSGRMIVRVPMIDGAAYTPYLEAIVPEFRRIMGPDVSIEVTGMLRLLGNTITAALETMVTSYATAFVVITTLMVLLIGRLRMGLISMIPNLVPVVFALGLMGWLGIALDMFTLMIGTIAIGLAVDDTIHFMHNFRRYYEQTGDSAVAVKKTLESSGQAMLFTTLVLASGFLVYTQAYMVHLFNFGLLTATAISVAFIADVTLAPALVTLATRRDTR